MPRPVSVASRLNVSKSALKMREVRDGRREKILDVEDRSVRRAIFLHPQKIHVADARIDVGKTITWSEPMSSSRGVALTKNIGTKVGKCCGYFLPAMNAVGPCRRPLA